MCLKISADGGRNFLSTRDPVKGGTRCPRALEVDRMDRATGSTWLGRLKETIEVLYGRQANAR